MEVTKLPLELQLIIIEKLIPLLSYNDRKKLIVMMHHSIKYCRLARKYSEKLESYSVIRYYNYRKGVSINVIKSFENFYDADEYALQKAKEEFSDTEIITEIVSNRQFVYVSNEITLYTRGDGSDTNVYSVVGSDGE